MTQGPSLRLAAILATLLLPAAARAASCEATTATGPAAALWTVSPGPARLNFLRGPEQPGCPADLPACRSPAFLVPGDAVVAPAPAAKSPWLCAAFANASGRVTTGWLPAAALTPAPATTSTTTPADWAGQWQSGPEQTIAVAANPDGTLTLRGDATYGGSDPARVRRGAVNIGQFEARLRPRGAEAGFVIAEDGRTLPYASGDTTLCRVTLRRLGPYLLAEDNTACGGMNVTFTGLYRRRG